MSAALPAFPVQVSGEAQYTDDVALPPNTLHAAFVTSVKPHAKLLGVDASAAVAMPGGLQHLLAHVWGPCLDIQQRVTFLAASFFKLAQACWHC